jgi:general L-amino acid transport system permease protein
MITASAAPKETFRLSMLVYDTRFRSLTIQLVVLVLFLLGVAWLVENAVTNLRNMGRDFDFGFLWQRAGYDINQRLIPYTNDSSNLGAAMVGLTNTLLVAFVGCILATLIGVVAGVLRLSKNWLLARLMTVYVEVFRNIPLLLWILVVFEILSDMMPEAKDFRVTAQMQAAGIEPAASMMLDGSLAVTKGGAYIPAPLLEHGLGSLDLGLFSLNLSFVVIVLVLLASFVADRWLRLRARAVQEATGQRPAIWWKSILILFGPIAVALTLLGLHWDFPVMGRFSFQGGIAVGHPFSALTLALALYTGAFIAEIVRSGILAISRGQSEAASALGLRQGRIMRLIVLPQALRVIIPPLISQYLNLTKNTSLAIAVSYMDLRATLGGVTMNQTGKELECMLLMMAVYLIISLIISSGMNIFNRAVRLKER